MRLLLINAIDTRYETETCLPNLGLGYLSSALKTANLDVECRVVDRYILEELEDWTPDLVGITSVSEHYGLASKYASLAKWANIPVIVGGIHISALPQTLTRQMDVGAIGEGEKTIVELVKVFQEYGSFNKRALAKIEGIAYHSGDRVVTTEAREMVLPLDLIRRPDRSILKIGKSTSMFSSRGCPYKCTFCSSTRFWDKARFFSAEYVAEEIEQLYNEYKVEHISFLDDLFVARKERLSDLVDCLARRNLLGKVTFSCSVRSNLVTAELCEMLKRLNVVGVGMGLESGCMTTLGYLKGKDNITVEDHSVAIYYLRKYGLAFHCSFIIGSPWESIEDIEETIQFIKNYKVKSFDYYQLTPFPGTPVWDYAKSRNLVSDDMDWSRLRVDSRSNKNPVMLSEIVSAKDLSRLSSKLDRMKKVGRMELLASEGIKSPSKIPNYVLGRFK